MGPKGTEESAPGDAERRAIKPRVVRSGRASAPDSTTRDNIAAAGALGTGLSLRQTKFCYLYVQNGGVALKAARQAGYSVRNTGMGTQLLSTPKIREHLAELLSRYWAEEQMRTEEILARLARIARRDVRMLFGPDGEYLALHELPDSVAGCLDAFETEIRSTAAGEIVTRRSYRFTDPFPALRLLAQINNLLQGRRGSDARDLGEALARARQRMREASCSPASAPAMAGSD